LIFFQLTFYRGISSDLPRNLTKLDAEFTEFFPKKLRSLVYTSQTTNRKTWLRRRYWRCRSSSVKMKWRRCAKANVQKHVMSDWSVCNQQ